MITAICLIVLAILGLGVATWLMVSGVMMILGALEFNAHMAAVVGIICLLAGGLIGYAAIEVAPINVELKVLQ